LLANAVVAGMLLTRAIPAWNDWLFYFYFVGYYVAIVGLVVSRSRRLDYIFLAWAISVNLLAGLGPLPNSEWGKAVGLSFSAQPQAARPR
jgi:CHASE2 domain-containing sensor protein